MLKEKYRGKEIVLESTEIGDDLLVLLYGGERGHIGSCILSIPRQSLDKEDEISCTSSVLNIVGHKDEEVGREAAEAITKKTKKKVMLVCGIHYDEVTDKDIKEIKDICRRLVQKYLENKK